MLAIFKTKQPTAGPILESKVMHAIFQKMSKKGQNIWKFGEKSTKFENILKKGGLTHTTTTCMNETARICPE